MRSFGSYAYLCALCASVMVSACNPAPSKITYEQVGACNANDVGAQDHLAFVFFRVQEIDNSQTNVGYTFHPKNLWINTGDLYSGYQYVATGQEANVLGIPPLLSGINVAANAKIPVNKYVVFLVQTTNPDGPTEANSTSYFFLYNNPPNDPGKLLVRSNAQQTSWPNTHRCADINFPK